MQAYPPGSVIVLPGDTPHFHWAKSGEYVTQVTAMGRSAWNTSIPAKIRVRKAQFDPAETIPLTDDAAFLPAGLRPPSQSILTTSAA